MADQEIQQNENVCPGCGAPLDRSGHLKDCPVIAESKPDSDSSVITGSQVENEINPTDESPVLPEHPEAKGVSTTAIEHADKESKIEADPFVDQLNQESGTLHSVGSGLAEVVRVVREWRRTPNESAQAEQQIDTAISLEETHAQVIAESTKIEGRIAQLQKQIKDSFSNFHHEQPEKGNDQSMPIIELSHVVQSLGAMVHAARQEYIDIEHALSVSRSKAALGHEKLYATYGATTDAEFAHAYFQIADAGRQYTDKFLGKIRFRQKLLRVRQGVDEFNNRSSLDSKMRYMIDDAERKLQQVTADAGQNLVEATSVCVSSLGDYMRTKIESMEALEPPEAKALDQQTVESLHETLFADETAPKLDKEHFSDDERATIESLIKESYSLPLELGHGTYSEAGKRNAVFYEKIDALPRRLRDFMTSELAYRYKCPDSFFQDATLFIQRDLPAQYRKKILIDAFRVVTEQTLPELQDPRTEWNLQSRTRGFSSLIRKLEQSSDSDEHLIQFFDNFKVPLWKILKSNPGIRQTIGDKTIEQAETVIVRECTKRLQNEDTPREKQEYYHNVLLDLGSAEALPALLVGSLTGSYRDIRNYVSGNPKKLAEIVSQLTPDQMQSLEQQHIPGLHDAIEVIKQYPAIFHQDRIYDRETSVDTLNPAFEKFQGAITKIAIHKLRTGQPGEVREAAQMISGTNGDLGEGYHDVMSALGRVLHKGVEQTLLHSVTRRITQGDEKMVQAWLDAPISLRNDTAIITELFNNMTELPRKALLAFEEGKNSSRVEHLYNSFQAVCNNWSSLSHLESSNYRSIEGLLDVSGDFNVLGKDFSAAVADGYLEVLKDWYSNKKNKDQSSPPHRIMFFSEYNNNLGALFENLRNHDAQNGQGRIQQFFKSMQDYFARSDQESEQAGYAQRQLDPEFIKTYEKSLSTFVQEVVQKDGKFFSARGMLQCEPVMRFFAKHPERLDEVLELTQIGFADSATSRNLISENIDVLMAIPREKRQDYLHVFKKINQSPSQEMQRVKSELIAQLIRLENPVSAYNKIESIFIKNNLPMVGKVFKIFEALNAHTVLSGQLKLGMVSPVLQEAGPRRRKQIIYTDLLRTHIESGNRSLRDYAGVLQSGESLFSKLESGGVEALSLKEREQLGFIFAKMQTLYENSQLQRMNKAEPEAGGEDLGAHYQKLRSELQCREGQSINDRIAEMFVRPAGFDSLGEMLQHMQQVKSEADSRGREEAKTGKVRLAPGDLLKGVNVNYISNILQNGSVAKEFLGAGASSDMTPLDTDVSKIAEDDTFGGFSGAIQESLAKGYGTLLFAIKDRGQFSITTKKTARQYDKKKLELFETGGGRHWGIRTGFPTSEIDFMIARTTLLQDAKTLQSVYYEIAQNGFYIPVVDDEGRVIFTSDDYDRIRETFEGVSRFEGPDLDLAPVAETDPAYRELTVIRESISKDAKRREQVAQTIRSSLLEILSKHSITLKSEFDTGLLGAELLDTGSTGRGTNVPGDYDFDLMIRLDDQDMQQVPQIVEEIRARFAPEREDSYSKETGQQQFRGFGIKGIVQEPIDMDVGFMRKSELISYGSHDAVKDKLDWVAEHHGEETKDTVIANIILAKKLLKEGKAYKKLEHGGMGGIGVENWILLHKGNIRDAFQSFLDAATDGDMEIPLDRFKQTYRVLDAGTNMQKGGHENFTDKLTEQGYRAMISTAETFLAKSNG